MTSTQLSKLGHPALVIADELRHTIQVVSTIDIDKDFKKQLTSLIEDYTDVELTSQLVVDATAAAMKDAEVYVYVMDLTTSKVVAQLLHDGDSNHDTPDDLSFLEPLVFCDAFWKISDKAAVKTLINSMGGKSAAKKARKTLEKFGRPSKYRDALKFIVNFSANRVESSQSQTTDGEPEEQTTTSDELPKELLNKLPKKLRKALKNGDAKATAVDISNLPVDVLEELRRLTKGKQIHELDNATTEKVLKLLKKQPNVTL